MNPVCKVVGGETVGKVTLNKVLVYFCEGCRNNHCIPFEGTGVLWQFDGSMDKPTLSPSVNSGPGYCHHFLKGGVIQFLGDCQHKLAGQTVPLKPLLDEEL